MAGGAFALFGGGAPARMKLDLRSSLPDQYAYLQQMQLKPNVIWDTFLATIPSLLHTTDTLLEAFL